MTSGSISLRWQYLLNDAYNTYFRRSRRIADAGFVPVSGLTTDSEYVTDARASATVWLRNIDRLIKASGIDTRKFHFLDVGCGKGVSTLYAQDQFRFAGMSGFDFDERLLAIAKENRDRSRVRNKAAVNFFSGDAGKIRIPEQRTFCFLFNPFGPVVLNLFIANNIDMLRSTGSVIGYANCRELHVLDRFPGVRINKVERFNSAAVSFV